METKALDSQSLFDIAIQTGGSVESAFESAVKNNISITNQLNTAQALMRPSVENSRVASYYSTKRLTPATDDVTTKLSLKGIGNMTIEQNFTVG